MEYLSKLYTDHLKNIAIPERNRIYLIRTTPIKHKISTLLPFMENGEREILLTKAMAEMNFSILANFSWKNYTLEFLLANYFREGCLPLLYDYIKNVKSLPDDLLSKIYHKAVMQEILLILQSRLINNFKKMLLHYDCCKYDAMWIKLYVRFDIKVEGFDEIMRKSNVENLKIILRKKSGKYENVSRNEEKIKISSEEFLSRNIKKLEEEKIIREEIIKQKNNENLCKKTEPVEQKINENLCKKTEPVEQKINENLCKKTEPVEQKLAENVNKTEENIAPKKPAFRRKLRLFSKKNEESKKPSPYKNLNLIEHSSSPKIFRSADSFTEEELEMHKKMTTSKITEKKLAPEIRSIFDHKKNIAVEIPMRKFKMTIENIQRGIIEGDLKNDFLISIIHDNWPTDKEIILLKERTTDLSYTEKFYRDLICINNAHNFFVKEKQRINDLHNGEILSENLTLLNRNLEILQNEEFSKFISLFLQLENQLSKRTMKAFRISSLFTSITKKSLLSVKTKCDIDFLKNLLQSYKHEISYESIKQIKAKIKSPHYDEAIENIRQKIKFVEEYIGESINEQFNNKMENLKILIQSI